jgi:16S rRNA A1518/A1519 N6-dimethyltransferase RsmA/KsgA/DIM1 with predicted DNA glycosylase/AP lyase activity
MPPIPWGELKAVVEAAFAHRRKRLPNSLELAGLADRGKAEEALAALGRPPTTRAEELAPREFVELAGLLR